MKSLSSLVAHLSTISSELANGEVFTEILERVASGKPDFEVGDHRFILSSSIDEVMVDELSGDSYMLGCFSASFLAGLSKMPLSYDSIKKIQEAEGFEAIGDIVLCIDGLLEELQEECTRFDGYGHHFATYDGEEYSASIAGKDYYIFKIN
jgi:hypothetical protein